ncbi:orotate phosphoribosyltransferase [Ignicoccus hospitalis]|nr:orotate phosphoribosyltransferase [Ignicoccus hospitalis]HIH89795.1 orotate phosphoribosyltransferase [Desulfurococcaceae archaeon]
MRLKNYMEAFTIASFAELPWTGSTLDAEALLEAAQDPMAVLNFGRCYIKSYLARRIQECGLVKRGTFILSSGKRSDVYVDMRKLWSFPKLARLAALLMSALIRSKVEYATIVGVATGGIPLAAHLSVTLGWPMGYARPKRKEHGQMRLVEGVEPGQKVVVVDDVTTTGGSLAKTIDALRDFGAEPVLAAALLDREEGSVEEIEKRGVEFIRLLTLNQVLRGLRCE